MLMKAAAEGEVEAGQSWPAGDDKSAIVLPFILSKVDEHRGQQRRHQHRGDGRSGPEQPGAEPGRPFIVGLNGVQGVGKTTLVRDLAAALRARGRRTLVVSIDDFYLRRADQQALAAAHPDNALLQCRGEPGTHDLPLARAFFDALCRQPGPGPPEVASAAAASTAPAPRPAALLKVPQYDKAAFSGRGDRVPEARWPAVALPVDVVILEGWCVGFRALADAEVEARWRAAPEPPPTKEEEEEGEEGGESSFCHARLLDDFLVGNETAVAAAAAKDDNNKPALSLLRRHPLAHLLLVNHRLRAYDAALTRRLDALVHVDAVRPELAYAWRLQQERALRAERGGDGGAMTDAEVVRFVDAYYPAYELYVDRLRAGLFLPDEPGWQLRLVVGRDRGVREWMVL